MILDDGCAWNGCVYRSLSQVAKAITGTNWNGHRFFGLKAVRTGASGRKRKRHPKTGLIARYWPAANPRRVRPRNARSLEFDDLVAENFASYKLRVSGLVEASRDFSLADLKAMAKQEQITTHFCIQGWSGVAEWGGVPVRDILDLVKPTPEARYAVFYSLADGAEGGRYYDVHSIENMRHELTILAYEMNGAPVSVLHGAPLRLRCENELGFKMVKWITAIEFVHDFADLGAGQGGYNEDHEFYGYRMPICRGWITSRASATRRSRGNRNALKHGGFTVETIALRREIAALARLARETPGAIE